MSVGAVAAAGGGSGDSDGFEFLGNGCWARWRWDHRYDDRANLAPLVKKAWSGPARRRFFGAATLAKQRDPSKKGERAAREVGEKAVVLLENLSVPVTRSIKRTIYEHLMVQWVCGHDVIAKGTADKEYENARAKIRRRLQRAHDDLGLTQLKPLL